MIRKKAAVLFLFPTLLAILSLVGIYLIREFGVGGNVPAVYRKPFDYSIFTDEYIENVIKNGPVFPDGFSDLDASNVRSFDSCAKNKNEALDIANRNSRILPGRELVSLSLNKSTYSHYELLVTTKSSNSSKDFPYTMHVWIFKCSYFDPDLYGFTGDTGFTYTSSIGRLNKWHINEASVLGLAKQFWLLQRLSGSVVLAMRTESDNSSVKAVILTTRVVRGDWSPYSAVGVYEMTVTANKETNLVTLSYSHIKSFKSSVLNSGSSTVN